MDLVKLVAEYGAHNLRFFVPMQKLQMMDIIPGVTFTWPDLPEDVVECVIDETRYKVSDNYKVTFRAIDPVYGREHFYISDFESIACNDANTGGSNYRVYVLTIDGYTQLKVTS